MYGTSLCFLLVPLFQNLAMPPWRASVLNFILVTMLLSGEAIEFDLVDRQERKRTQA